MAVEIKDVQEVAENLQKSFDEFKEKNNKRIEGIEQEKGKLAGEVETLNSKLTELEKLKGDLESELAAVKRPGAAPSQKWQQNTQKHLIFLCVRAAMTG